MTMWSNRVGDELSPKQREILQLAAEGFYDKEIAAKMEPPISYQTVKNQMVIIRRKLGARDRAHVAALAVKYGLANVEPDLSVNQDI